MKRQPQNDLRYQKTEALIEGNFRKMLGEMEYSQITIKELTRRAQINRKTFYLHYPSMDNLLIRLQKELIDRFSQAVKHTRLPEDVETVVSQFFGFFLACDECDKKLLCYKGHFSTSEYSQSREGGQDYQYDALFADYSALEKNILGAFITGSLCEIYKQWNADRREIPLEDIVRMTTQLISQGLNARKGASEPLGRARPRHWPSITVVNTAQT